ncbi:chemotaxis protein CheB [Nitrosococcus oceani]|uniref:protein-glutamate methylesterase n=2 Tax=Nitrosococcus oceani TaxID=1229 RepID=Q3JET8_NITOC|nr:chemotaxis protein CheB [Nitrosococcus oceani]KFI20904.1 chemotaxis protein CheB [Nitrosococcus oceani C-27]ABA56658.1 CheB methylesterase [Nitrosococcus oceani ATCC 19707]EDZ66438.1 protein-glutamate methylesterase CheB [Nitrosococcus oceani AFC27]KFI23987.1 chemotaxis protein CheB [Nitrosococcus oceani]GEM20772.1 chemotaxis protein CheB [Nitrosococcus oceani]
MLPSKPRLARVAIACNCEDTRLQIRHILEQHGLSVVADGPPDMQLLTIAESRHANVLFIGLNKAYEKQAQAFEKFLEQTSLPMLFNENISHAQWGQRASEKLAKLANSAPAARIREGKTPRCLNPHGFSAERKTEQRVWVLGASTGGPQALQSFLSAIPETLPITFIVAQHIGANFLGLFTKQLAQYTCFSVEIPKPGHQLQNQQVLITPEKYDLSFDDNCCLTLLPAIHNYRYNPSIDSIMHAVSKHFGAMAGAIIFSGMGEDGAQGCHHFLTNGGTVWAQDTASCEISSMPDYARATGAVSFSAPPEELARSLVNLLENTHVKNRISRKEAIS